MEQLVGHVLVGFNLRVAGSIPVRATSRVMIRVLKNTRFKTQNLNGLVAQLVEH